MLSNNNNSKGACPYCNKKPFSYTPNQWYYGSPVRTCKKCGQKYLDRRYHEIAVEGFEGGTLSTRTSLGAAGFGVLLFIVGGGIHLFEIYRPISTEIRTIHTMWCYLALMGAVLALIMLVDCIRIKTGAKANHLETLRQESIERLKDTEYARLLANEGYSVPDEFMQQTF